MTPTLDPLARFEAWVADAEAAGVPQPDAMTLATAAPGGAPSARVVLYKGLAHGALRFVTNYTSRKGRELDANPRAALLFWWQPLGRQLRVEGSVVRAPAADSDAYFASRPRGSQLGAWASEQSAVIASPGVVTQRLAEYAARFPNDVPRPGHWGAYLLTPASLEFWEHGEHRLHTRLRYRRQSGGWHADYLAP